MTKQLTVNKYQSILLEEFYLDQDDKTIRRKKDGWGKRYMKHDIVIGYKLCSHGYEGIHIPGTRTSVSKAHLITLLRSIVIPDNCVIDHRNGDDLDNSRANLRIVPQQVNCKNTRKRNDNSSGVTGISWNKAGQHYIVRKSINGVRKYVGCAPTLNEAKYLLETVEQACLQDGYTLRHGQ